MCILGWYLTRAEICIIVAVALFLIAAIAVIFILLRGAQDVYNHINSMTTDEYKEMLSELENMEREELLK